MNIILENNDLSDSNALSKTIILLKRLLDAASGQTKSGLSGEKDALGVSDVQVPAAPSLQLEVLILLADSATGSLTSYEVAELLGMSQPSYAAKIRGTGKAGVQAQDVLYERNWTFQGGRRVRVYTITAEGRRVAAKLKKPAH